MLRPRRPQIADVDADPPKPERWIRREDVPAYLNFVATLALGVFALLAFLESQRTTLKLGEQLARMAEQVQAANLQTSAAQATAASAREAALATATATREAAEASVAATREAAQASVAAAQEQVKLAYDAQRPWLTAEFNISGPITRAPNGYSVPITSKLRNVGRSAAKAVVSALELSTFRAVQPLDVALPKRQKETCRRPADQQTDNNQSDVRRIAILPDQIIGVDNKMKVDPAMFAEDTGSMILEGCLLYLSPLDKEEHHTYFAFFVSPKGSANFPADLTTIDYKTIELSPIQRAGVFTAD